VSEKLKSEILNSFVIMKIDYISCVVSLLFFFLFWIALAQGKLSLKAI